MFHQIFLLKIGILFAASYDIQNGGRQPDIPNLSSTIAASFLQISNKLQPNENKYGTENDYLDKQDSPLDNWGIFIKQLAAQIGKTDQQLGQRPAPIEPQRKKDRTTKMTA